MNYRRGADPAFRAICKLMRIRNEEIDTTKRGAFNVYSRRREQLVWLMRQTTDASYPEIARICGQASHSSAMDCCRRFAARIEADAELRAEAERMVQVVMGGRG